MESFHEPIPKKVRKTAKHCALCKKHGGAPATHNMSDCRKYEKDGKPKKGFGKGQHCSTALDKKTASAFTELSAKVEQLEKANKRLKKSSKKRKHEYDSDTVTLTPPEGAGPVAHGGRNCSQSILTNSTQLDKYTIPCSNKATDSLLSNSNLHTQLMHP
eukprot:CCRYP_016291-RA/>CCRYP_016291-RA protein AED:0.36 eAED:0.36 QI:0/-1/0/1/-1/1/1/0/158